MDNARVAALLYQLADYAEIKGEDFPARAYRRAAQFIETFSEDIHHYYKSRTLTGLPGIGQGIAKKIIDLFEYGESTYLKKIKKEFPIDVESIRKVGGMGPKKIKILFEELKIKNIITLEKAAKQGKIRTLTGFGEKSERQILDGIAFAKQSKGRTPLKKAVPIAKTLITKLKKVPGVKKIKYAGSLRRKKKTIGDIDLLAICDNTSKLVNVFTTLPEVKDILAQGKTKSSIKLKSGLQIDLRIVKAHQWGAALQYFTGSQQHNVQMRRIAKKKGYKLNEYGLFKGREKIAGKTEKGIYAKLGVPYIEPEHRETT